MTLESAVSKIVKRLHSNESYGVVLSYGAIQMLYRCEVKNVRAFIHFLQLSVVSGGQLPFFFLFIIYFLSLRTHLSSKVHLHKHN